MILFSWVNFYESLTLDQLSAKTKCWSKSVVVARWFRPAIDHAQDSLWLVRPGVGYIFMVFLCRVSLFVQAYVTFLFLIFFFLLFLKNKKTFDLGLSFDFFVFYFVLCCFAGLSLLRSYIHILLVVSGNFVFGYKWGKIWRKLEVVYLIFKRR